MTWIEKPRTVSAEEGPEGGSLEARASIVFKVIGVIGIAGAIFSILPDSFPNSALLTVAFNLATVLVSGLYFVQARGLDKGRPWAYAAVRPMLVLLGAWGAYAFFAGLIEGILRIPFELAMVVWAFLGAKGPIRAQTLSGPSLGIVIATVPLLIVMAFGYVVFGWGGLLDVDPPDLTATIRVDCGDPGADPPAEIPVVYEWAWARGAPLPNEVDTLFIGWTGNDAEGHPLYIFGRHPESDPTIRSGQRGTLGRELLEEARGTTPGFQWAVDLYRRGYQPGRVDLTLRLASENPTGPRSLTVRAWYIHLGEWQSEAQPVTCTW